MKRGNFVSDEYYHVYNRGVEKSPIYKDDNDRLRFLTILMLFQGDILFPQVNRITLSVKHLMLDRNVFDENIMDDILKTRIVELVSFVMMPNHFHLILHALTDNAISKYMQRLGNAYAKYFNTKHSKVGHLFERTFNSIHIDNNEYLNYLSTYIHLNPRKLKPWYKREEKYPWSSFQDYSYKNRFGLLLDPSIVMSQFSDGEEYKAFVKESDINILEYDLSVKH